MVRKDSRGDSPGRLSDVFGLTRKRRKSHSRDFETKQIPVQSKAVGSGLFENLLLYAPIRYNKEADSSSKKRKDPVLKVSVKAGSLSTRSAGRMPEEVFENLSP